MSLFDVKAVPAAATVAPIAVAPVAPVQPVVQGGRPKREAPDAWGNIEIPMSDGSSNWLRNKFIRIEQSDTVEMAVLQAVEMAFALHTSEGKSPDTFDFVLDVKLHINPANGATKKEVTGAFQVASTEK